MSDENFLARWSRRKRETGAIESPQIEPAAAPVAASPPAVASEQEKVDLSSLPSLESITGETDITAFLRKGIPQDLSRAALRRAWESDPAIRDFVGLAENAWDFNDPNAMPGFGPLDYTEEQLATLVNRIVGGVRSAADQLTAAMPGQADQAELAGSNETQEAVAGPEPIPVEDSPQTLAAVQPPSPERRTDEQPAAHPRTHGSALPR